MLWNTGLCFWILIPGILGSTVLTTGGFPKSFLNDITESPVVRARLNSRWKWEVWDIVPGTHIYYVYVFNITNPDEVEQGTGKPSLKQVGPYAYIEHRVKHNVSINLDLSVNFERTFTYTFHPELSNGTENDLVNALNLPFIIFSTLVADGGNAGVSAVKALVSQGETLIKRRQRVADLIIDGMNVSKYEPYLNLMGNPASDLVQEFQTGKYGVLKLRRGAHEKPYTLESGLKDASNVGVIKLWDNAPDLHFWYGPTCNSFSGATEYSVFPPHISKDDKLRVLDRDMCRSIDFTYKEDSSFRDTVPVYNFRLDKDVLADPRNYSANMCFCKNAGKNAENCLKAGVLDVASCNDGAPYIISYPHFYEADPEYLQGVVGLKPTATLHSTHLNVEPRLGAVTQYWKRFQWNIQLQPLKNLEFFHNTKSIVFPVLWLDDNFALDDDKAELLIAELANLAGGWGSSGSEGFHGRGPALIIFLTTIIFALWSF